MQQIYLELEIANANQYVVYAAGWFKLERHSYEQDYIYRRRRNTC